MDVYRLLEKIEQGDIEQVKRFIRSHPDSVSQPILYGLTPLMQAIQYRKTNIVKLLLDGGADVNRREEFTGWTALHYAVIRNQPEAVAILLQHPTIQVNPQNNGGQTPLHWACSKGYKDIVGSLLSHIGIKPNVVNKDGDTPLHFAVQSQNYDVVTLMLSQDSVELEVKNHKKMTPLLEAISVGHLGIMHCLIARGANVNDVDGEGNSCLHLALKREVFNSEGAPMDILNKCCTDLNLKTEERLSGVVVARYLASQGADLHHKNNNNNTPLDLIKDPNLRKKFETFLPPKCVFCENEDATETFFPCKHLSLCKKCCPPNIPKRYLKCGRNITSKTTLEDPNSSKREVQTLREPTEKRTFEDKETQTLAEPIVCPKFDEKASQTLPEPVGRSRMFSEKEIQTEAEPVQITKFVQEALKTSQQIESPKLGEKDLLTVAQNLGKNWWQVGIFLGIKSIELEIIKCDNPLNTVEQSYQMLLRWATRCDPETNKLETLKESLKSGQCLTALVCLLNIK